MKNENWLTVAEAAEYLGVSKSLLNLWRHKNTGPAYYKMGKIYYSPKDLDVYFKSTRVAPGEANDAMDQ